MNKDEAKSVLQTSLAQYEQMSWSELSSAASSNRVDDFEADSESGTRYQIEVNFFWDTSSRETVRVSGSVDDGGLHAFAPIGHDLLIEKPKEA